MPADRRLVEGVGDGGADEACTQDDGCEDDGVEADVGPAYLAEAGDGEDAQVEKEHGDADAAGRGVPDDSDGDEDLCCCQSGFANGYCCRRVMAVPMMRSERR